MTFWHTASIAVLGIIALATHTSGQEVGIETAVWISGCWEAHSGTSTIEEQWMAPSGGLMLGMSRTTRDGAPTGYEFLLLRASEGGLTYRALPSGQTPTDFRSSRITKTQLVFENPDHDFPQKIVYRWDSTRNIVASVFGTTDATEPAFQLNYEKVSCSG